MDQSAVLTGDLIASTAAGPEAVSATIALLRTAANDFETLGRVSHPLRFTRYRGDGWQIALHKAHLSLRLATYLLARLRAADIGLGTRIGIGIGMIDDWGTGDLSGAHGTAFVASGRALDSLGASGVLASAPADTPAQIWLESALETLVYLSSRWSVEQAQAIALRVTHQKPFSDRKATHTELAQRLGISRQALSSRLAAAGEKPIMAAIRATEKTL